MALAGLTSSPDRRYFFLKEKVAKKNFTAKLRFASEQDFK